jgi:hypothetical protein
MKHFNLKNLNKLFVFFSILLILSTIMTNSCLGAKTQNQLYLEAGCDTTSSPNVNQNALVQQNIKFFYMGKENARKYGTGYVQYAGPRTYINSLDGNTFLCNLKGVSNASQYTEVMTFYYDDEGTLRHTTAYTTIQFATEDIFIDLDNGRLITGNLMYSNVDAWNRIFKGLSSIVTGISGIGILCCILAFVLQIMKLGTSASNPAEREKAIKGLLWTGIGTAGCGAAAFIFGLAYSLI